MYIHIYELLFGMCYSALNICILSECAIIYACINFNGLNWKDNLFFLLTTLSIALRYSVVVIPSENKTKKVLKTL